MENTTHNHCSKVKEITKNLSKFPKYGWKVSLDHKFPEKRDQKVVPRLNQLPALLPLLMRYMVWYARIRSRGRKPFIDGVKLEQGKQMYGVPLGGIGSGTIGRGFKGEFCRYQMIPGTYEYHTIMANQFIVTIRNSSGNTLYQKVLSPLSSNKGGLKSWEWGFSGSDGLYCGLYPRSWTVYNLKETGIRLICRQISPVMPNEYKDHYHYLNVNVATTSLENAYVMKETMCTRTGAFAILTFQTLIVTLYISRFKKVANIHHINEKGDHCDHSI